ncbi:hypothetical protein TNCV_4497371 [Trichonephila clavipes]|nr:hypothetical protein TNCV_4497371 [Trichonephila clavipes]
MNPIAFVADIKTAFLMIEIDESERDFTRFFWDENPGIDLENKRLDIFRMTRVLFGYKATHLEVVSTLTTEAFPACLRRFIARRSKPSVI